VYVLVFNPGGNSLKAEIVQVEPGQTHAYEGKYLASVSVEGIGKEPALLRYEGKKIVARDPIDAADYQAAARQLLHWFGRKSGLPALDRLACAGIRVVHGGTEFIEPARMTDAVAEKIRGFENLAPLHNKNSLEVLQPLRDRLTQTPIYGVFDTAFHHTIPDVASTYAIPHELARKHGIRRFGFHGISHRYQLERYAALAGRAPNDCTLVTMHLESGCSVTAIRNGKSVDNTMGMTPLEGLMMGTRSGDIDPALIPFLMRQERLEVEDVMKILNKESGLLGVSGESLDTRELMKSYESNARVRLAMNVFCYRVVKAVGAYLAALGGADAIIFGGGIAENNLLLRKNMGEALRWCGLEIDRVAEQKLIDVEGRLSTERSPLQAWVIPVEEGLQIAYECSLCADVQRSHSGKAV
jgi:acetate kinase